MPLDGEPEPFLAPFAAHKRPHLIQFQLLHPPRQRAAGGPGLRFFLPVWLRSCAPPRSGARWPAARPVRAAASARARTAPLGAEPLAQTRPDAGRRYTGIWLG